MIKHTIVIAMAVLLMLAGSSRAQDETLPLLAYGTLDEAGALISTVRADGSDQQPLLRLDGLVLHSLAWLPDGERLVYATSDPADYDTDEGFDFCELQLLDTRTMQTTRLPTGAPLGLSVTHLRPSPDGEWLALSVTSGDESGYVAHQMVVSVDGQAAIMLEGGTVPGGTGNLLIPAWEGDTVYYTHFDEGVFGLWSASQADGFRGQAVIEDGGLMPVSGPGRLFYLAMPAGEVRVVGEDATLRLPDVFPVPFAATARRLYVLEVGDHARISTFELWSLQRETTGPAFALQAGTQGAPTYVTLRLDPTERYVALSHFDEGTYGLGILDVQANVLTPIETGRLANLDGTDAYDWQPTR